MSLKRKEVQCPQYKVLCAHKRALDLLVAKKRLEKIIIELAQLMD
jgi:hypothetical protein